MALLLLADAGRALVFASPDTEPPEGPPPDFPYWEHVTQRRYEGPSVVYLGGGWALTARHVGRGEIFLAGQIYEPRRTGHHTLLNENGTAADAMVFELDRSRTLPNWPRVPIVEEPVRVGEDLLLIGFGKGRARVIEANGQGQDAFAFEWTRKGEKRWGTNRVSAAQLITSPGTYTTRSFTFEFDEPFSAGATRYEVQAAIGDSGGAAFVERDGVWQLAGIMISVSNDRFAPENSSTYGDRTHVADLSVYREEIMRWTRPACANERDDDGDELVDYPLDPGCDSADDGDERDTGPLANSPLSPTGLAIAGLLVGFVASLLLLRWRRARRRAQASSGTSTPSSTSPSIEA